MARDLLNFGAYHAPRSDLTRARCLMIRAATSKTCSGPIHGGLVFLPHVPEALASKTLDGTLSEHFDSSPRPAEVDKSPLRNRYGCVKRAAHPRDAQAVPHRANITDL